MFQVTRDEGLRKVEDLVEAFDRSLKAYKSLAYKEAQVRAEYIDPFFEALGWDIYNKSHFAEAYKDVIHEDAIKTGGAHKAPDYSFRIGGRRVYFVEAKKPSVNIKDDPRVVYQLRRYGWSAGLNLSILTDFEEFAVYDCRVRPKETDKPGISRVQYLSFDRYLDQYDEIRDLFGKESVMQGSLDRYAESKKRMRGTAPVDKEFLKEIENWREFLARNIALRNPDLSVHELNFAVQRIIDRIIFLRICEDRGIEHYGRLQALATGANAYQRLVERFDRAEERYNSGLFHFERERNQTTEPDSLTPRLQIDDKVLQEIFKGLYYPDSPYEFSVVGADILGQVYEQFLGKVIRLTTGHRAKIEAKPEVRKAGGVYYTPTYIVDYIVRNTVGRLCEGEPDEADGEKGDKTSDAANRDKRSFKLTPRQVRKLRILDPACGSGSFLIGAYQYLLDYCRDWYVANDPAKHKKAVYQGREGQWFLTQAEKKSILLDCIYGVDIDSQAVEVTKLNLLLKALEGESRETLEQQLKLFQERALPDLGANIKCGNSLIGTDFFDHHQDTLFDDDQLRRINPFDWDGPDGFPEIMKKGGFDAVIGNPPYGAIADSHEISYFRGKYKSALSTCDSFALFIERSSIWLSKSRFVGMIVQSAWISAPSFLRLRQEFIMNFRPLRFVALPYDIFGAYVDTVIFIAERLPYESALRDLSDAKVDLTVFPVRHKILTSYDFTCFSKTADATRCLLNKNCEFLITLSSQELDIIEKIRSKSVFLSEVADIQRGVTPFNVCDREPEIKPYAAFTGTVRRYKLIMGDPGFIRYDSSLAEFKPLRYFTGPRILLRELISRQFQLQAVYADIDFVTNKSMQSILVTDDQYDIMYILGCLNSKLMSWYFLSIQSVARRDDFPKIVLKQTRELPLYPLKYNEENDQAMYNKITELATKIVDLWKKNQTDMSDHDRNLLNRHIESTDRALDSLVYKLYDISDDEISIIEESVLR